MSVTSDVETGCKAIFSRSEIKGSYGFVRERLAHALGIGPQHVSVKAKTNEGMGWLGRGEGIAAMAVVLLNTIEG